MISEKIKDVLKVEYFLLLILVVSGLFFVINDIHAAEMLYHPLICTDGATTYDCGYRPTYQDIWVCGIEMVLSNYQCPARADSVHTAECKNADVWFRENACPNTDSYNGKDCILADPAADCLGNGIVDEIEGYWNAKDKSCVLCSGNERTKLLASTTQKCYNYTVAGCPFAGVARWDELLCANDFAGKCDYGCGASLECNHEDDALGIPVTGGFCDNCVFHPVCSWQIDACGQSPCAPTERHQTCGPAGCSGGVCAPGSTQCVDDPACHPCEATCTCTCSAEIKCPGGTCPPELRGGLVPCGRSCDDPCTEICECAPCTLCHLFVLFKRIVDFLTLYILFPLAVLMIVVGGVMFLIAAGDPEKIRTAKKILTSVVIGLVIIFLAWLIVDTIIVFIVSPKPEFAPLRNWSTINCPVP